MRRHQPRTRKARRGRLRGFTLVEVMSVIGISAALAAMAVPNFYDAIKRQRARSQMERYSQMIRLARNQARTTLCDIDLTIDADAGTITMGPEATTGDCADLSTLQQSLDTTLIEIAVPTVGGTATNPFQFERRGGTAYSNPGIFQVTNKATSKVYNISVWPAIGTVEMK